MLSIKYSEFSLVIRLHYKTTLRADKTLHMLSSPEFVYNDKKFGSIFIKHYKKNEFSKCFNMLLCSDNLIIKYYNVICFAGQCNLVN